MKTIAGIFLVGILMSVTPRPLRAAFGVTSTFAKVKLGAVEAGRPLRLSTTQQPLTVTNTSDIPVTLTLRVIRPSKNDVEAGFEPVPSVTWAVLEKNEFKLAPGESATTDIILKPWIDQKYRGKSYQLHILTRAVSGGNVRIVMIHKLQFTVAKETSVSQRALRKQLKFKIKPPPAEVNNVDVGKLSNDPQRMLVIKNTDRKPHHYRIQTCNPEASVKFEGYSSRTIDPSVQLSDDRRSFTLLSQQAKTVDAGQTLHAVFDGLLPRNWVSVGVKEFYLQPGEKRLLPIKLYLPRFDVLKNQSFVPLIRVTQLDGNFPSLMVPVYLATSNVSYDDPPSPEFQRPVYFDVLVAMAD